MGFESMIGKYDLVRTIGEGAFAKVKLALNTDNGQYVAIKIINKQMIIKNNLIHQVEKEIRAMKLLNHPNIVRIHEVLGTKTKVYIVMEYASGGQLSDRTTYMKRLSEKEARKLFQQLVDAVEYCHCRGVYHRDLKPQNMLLDGGGNLEVSDFGLSALRKPGCLLSTACGSPSYVAPELITKKCYEGAAADVWSCGVILFEILSGYLPFDDSSLTNLYRKICKADYKFPEWFTAAQKNLLGRIFDPNPRTRITIAEILEDPWFQTEYEPAMQMESGVNMKFNDVNATFNAIKANATETKIPCKSGFINAFQLIAMSHDLDLSGLFEEQDNETLKITLGSQHGISETMKKIEAAAKDVSLLVERTNSKIKMRPKQKIAKCCRSCFELSAKVIEVTPKHCVVEISKSAGQLRLYKEFCKNLSSMLIEESRMDSEKNHHGEVLI